MNSKGNSLKIDLDKIGDKIDFKDCNILKESEKKDILYFDDYGLKIISLRSKSLKTNLMLLSMLRNCEVAVNQSGFSWFSWPRIMALNFIQVPDDIT